jgi:hypothetical protein
MLQPKMAKMSSGCNPRSIIPLNPIPSSILNHDLGGRVSYLAEKVISNPKIFQNVNHLNHLNHLV